MKKILTVLGLLLALGSAPVLARQALMEQPARTEFLKSENTTPSIVRARNAILQGGSRFGWQAVSDEPGKITLRYDKGNGRHIVTIAVAYDAAGFQISYVDSFNMNYEVVDGAAEIHPNYNRWITNLGKEIVNRQLQQ
ncbi:hypothetical protein [Chitinilyticum litopenaei]|uniref:hypothetical protein n=1 Tax=Chitinilyticum litopenaei TaxID=1121276 RepID=UPI000429C407|nr:hypothetical protein [Chitinilyticum litopenaei]